MKIYIACGLTHVPREFFCEYSDFLHNLASSLKQENAGHIVKYALVNSDPQLAEHPPSERAKLCYEWDRNIVQEVDLVIGEASFPSIGLGIELQIAISKATPIILCYRNYRNNKAEPVCYENPDKSIHQLQIGKGFISLMALGLPTVQAVIEYYKYEDGIAKVIKSVNSIEGKNTKPHLEIMRM
jgi:hypothetical protein